MTEFTQVGARLGGRSGIQELMDDLGRALGTDPHMRMLGGGNPAAIPEVQALWRRRWRELLEDEGTLDRALVNYDSPAGGMQFREAFADFLRRNCGWKCGAKNIVVLPGGQTAFFYLFALLAGATDSGKKRILFPIAPEYIGYANQALDPGAFVAMRPIIEKRPGNEFKYHIDFDRLRITPDIAAICLSCPTNPTGNVISGAELERLREIAARHGIPLILDQAYGRPFPGAIFVDWQPVWDENMIVSISLSKLGLPGTRTSIIVADEKIVTTLANMNAVVALANGNIGQALLKPLLEGDQLIRLSNEVIRPFYEERSAFAHAQLQRLLDGKAAFAVHAREGAFFLWLWLKELRVTSAELYERLKKRHVLVVPGHYFFFGLDGPWEHSHQCIRITFSQPHGVVQEGLEILADEVMALQKS